MAEHSRLFLRWCSFRYISQPAASECLKPEIAKDLAQPLPPSLTTVLGQDNAVLLSWYEV